ncbi:MAG: hypothetical protein ACLQUY_13620 [Ktedonobacterales bacterium]
MSLYGTPHAVEPTAAQWRAAKEAQAGVFGLHGEIRQHCYPRVDTHIMEGNAQVRDPIRILLILNVESLAGSWLNLTCSLPTLTLAQCLQEAWRL